MYGSGNFSGSGTWSHEIGLDNGEVYDATDDVVEPVLQPLATIMQDNNIQSGEIVADISVQGSHTPGSMYGGYDHLGWKEEHYEERSADSLYILADKKRIPIPPDIADPILARYDDEIQESEYEVGEPDYYESVVHKVSNLITEDPDVMGGSNDQVEIPQGMIIGSSGYVGGKKYMGPIPPGVYNIVNQLGGSATRLRHNQLTLIPADQGDIGHGGAYYYVDKSEIARKLGV